MAAEDRLSRHLSHNPDLQIALIQSGKHEVQMLHDLLTAALKRLKPDERANLALRMTINEDLHTYKNAYHKPLSAQEELNKKLITVYKEYLNEKKLPEAI